jgi:hypothetical protein
MSSNWLDNVLSPGIIFRPPNLSLITEKLGSNILDTKKPNFNHFHKKKKRRNMNTTSLWTSKILFVTIKNILINPTIQSKSNQD